MKRVARFSCASFFFLAPHGLSACREKWDVSRTAPALAIGDVQGGSILLYHTNPKDIECLKVLIPQLLEQGYTPVTVSELLGLPPVETRASVRGIPPYRNTADGSLRA